MLEVAQIDDRDRKAGTGRISLHEESSGNAAKGFVKFNSTRFGGLVVEEKKIISFPNGILGLPDAKRFMMLDYEGDVPFKWLQCVDEPALAFLVVEPDFIKPDYKITLRMSDIAEIGEAEDKDVVIMAILTIPEGNPKGMTANLRGPLVINSLTLRGKQVVLEDDRYLIRYPLFS